MNSVGTGGKEKRSAWLRLVAVILRPFLTLGTKRDWRGRDNVPASGGAILVCNHISLADPLVIAHYIYDRPRVPRFLAKESLFHIPVAGYLIRKAGQIPVRRGSTDAVRSLEAATKAIGAGAAVIIYPEGTRTQDRELWPMRGKTGAARLALTTGAPVIPISQWGAQNIHHRFTGKIRLWRVPVIVSAGEPVDLSAWKGKPLTAEVLREATEAIMLRLRNDVAVLRDEPAPSGPLFVPVPAGRSVAK